MRSSTYVHIAIRNVGDSQDTGKFHEGTLTECVMWMASELSKVSMATRIVVGLGRNKEDAGRGIDVKGAGASALNSDMQAMLSKIFEDGEESKDQPFAAAPKKLEGDDYEGDGA